MSMREERRQTKEHVGRESMWEERESIGKGKYVELDYMWKEKVCEKRENMSDKGNAV